MVIITIIHVLNVARFPSKLRCTSKGYRKSGMTTITTDSLLTIFIKYYILICVSHIWIYLKHTQQNKRYDSSVFGFSVDDI